MDKGTNIHADLGNTGIHALVLAAGLTLLSSDYGKTGIKRWIAKRSEGDPQDR